MGSTPIGGTMETIIVNVVFGYILYRIIIKPALEEHKYGIPWAGNHHESLGTEYGENRDYRSEVNFQEESEEDFI